MVYFLFCFPWKFFWLVCCVPWMAWANYVKLLFSQSLESVSSGHTIVKFYVLIPSFQCVVCKKLSQPLSLLVFYHVAVFVSLQNLVLCINMQEKKLKIEVRIPPTHKTFFQFWTTTIEQHQLKTWIRHCNYLFLINKLSHTKLDWLLGRKVSNYHRERQLSSNYIKTGCFFLKLCPSLIVHKEGGKKENKNGEKDS